ncbi:MAG: Na+/H+ antiporter [Rhizobiales bacterium 65-9]|nr:Na+/H+ antiporter [Hyphomicrobiales bacterium]OJY36801.1 MAG: Na+/H+ antiporter [Rhizobiales bacterium 65-9]
MQSVILILLLLLLAAVSGPLARVARLPLPIAQIAMGLALAWPTAGLHIDLEPELFLLIFIPPLLFADARLAPKREFVELAAPILGLAFGLAIATVVVFGYGLHWWFPALPLSVAFALAAVLSPTDAVAVASIVNRHAVPDRLMQILQGEALFNDATGLVIFRFAVAATLSGGFSLAETSGAFVGAVIGGVGAGLLVVFSFAQALKLLSRSGAMSPEAQVTATLLLPFAAYLLAEHIGASGILAAVAGGMTSGLTGMYNHMTPTARLQSSVLLETVVFVFNGVIFLLLGLQLPAIIRNTPSELMDGALYLGPVAAVVGLTAALILLRFAWIVTGVLARSFASRLRGAPAERESLRVQIVGSLAGVRGAVTLAGILSLPIALPDGSAFPGRDLSIFLAAGVILCSLLVASLLLPLAARGLRMPGDDPMAEEERLARIASAQAAIARLETLAREVEDERRDAAHEVASRLIETYRRRVDTRDEQEEVYRHARTVSEIENDMMRAAIRAERETMRRLAYKREINDETLHKLLNEIILVEALLERRAV